jgi:antitoxin (DNA-binding transcriptional repressor) of toxin-antitoxin stability system
MKTAGLREFKAHLSRYVRSVATGERLLVTFRGRPLVEVRRALRGQEDPLLAAGFMPAKKPNGRPWADRSAYGLKPADFLSPSTIAALLDLERGE